MHKPRLGFIGVGKVGATLALSLDAAGYKITALYNRSAARAESLAAIIGALVVETPAAALNLSDLTFLTVADSAIGILAHEIAANGPWENRAVIHTSGAYSVDKLAPLADAGLMVGSLHPAFPFADVDSAVQSLPGASFAMEAQDVPVREWLSQIVIDLHGHVIDIPPGKKAVYHAAMVFASNYTVSLFATAEHLLSELNADRPAARQALLGILQATVGNLTQRQTTADALTGPLVRGDTSTIQAHLAALQDHPEVRASYLQLARLSVPLLRMRGLDAALLTQLEKLFEEEV